MMITTAPTTCGDRFFGPGWPARFLRLLSAVVVAAVLALSQSGCSHAEIWEELPADVASFITQYFPNSELQSYSHNAGTYHVRIADGAGLTFGPTYQWTDIDGYGMPLPQVLLFDQLPPKIYSYLQETEQLNAVFAIRRDAARYTVTLLDNDLIYDISSGQLSGTVPKG